MPDSVDLKAAMDNPTSQFACPKDVVGHPDLARADKIKILRQWELDASLTSVAEEENMSGGEQNLLGEVVKALIALGAEPQKSGTKETPSPAKHGH